MFASATPVQAATELKATYENTNALSYLTYQQPYSSMAWSAYYPKAGSFNGYLLKWEYGKNLDMNYKRSLSVSSFPTGTIFPVTIIGTNVADRNGIYYGQCASFVKSVAKSTVATKDWGKGRNVLSSYKTHSQSREALQLRNSMRMDHMIVAEQVMLRSSADTTMRTEFLKE